MWLAAGAFHELLAKNGFNGSPLPVFGAPWKIWIDDESTLHDLHRHINGSVQEGAALKTLVKT